MSRLVRSAALVWLPLVGAGVAVAQQAPATTFTETVDVNIVNVDLWVTTRKGEPAHGLKVRDFEVFEDDQPVEIVNFYAESRESPSPRSMVVYVDDTYSTAPDRNNVLAELVEFVARRVEAESMPVMLARYDGRVQVLLDFSTDLEAVRDAFRSLGGAEPRPSESRIFERAVRAELEQTLDLMRGGGQERSVARSSLDGMLASARGYGRQIAADTRSSLAALGSLASGLGTRPGVKEVYWVGDGIVLRPLSELVTSVQREMVRNSSGRQYSDTDVSQGEVLAGGRASGGPNMVAQGADFVVGHFDSSLEELDSTPDAQRLGALANSARVTLVPIRPPVSDAASSGLGNRANEKERSLSDMLEGAVLLADLTGGVAMVAGQDVGDFLKRVGEDRPALYSLGFRAGGGPGFHSIRVKTKRGSRARYRQSYVAKSRDDLLADRTLATLAMGWQENPHEIEVRLDSLARNEDGNYEVGLLVSLPIRRLEMVEAEGVYRGDCRVAIVIANPEGRVTRPQFMEVPLRIPAADVEAARGQRYGARLSLLLAPGDQRVSIGVWDVHGGRGSFVEHPVSLAHGG